MLGLPNVHVDIRHRHVVDDLLDFFGHGRSDDSGLVVVRFGVSAASGGEAEREEEEEENDDCSNEDSDHDPEAETEDRGRF